MLHRRFQIHDRLDASPASRRRSLAPSRQCCCLAEVRFTGVDVSASRRAERHSEGRGFSELALQSPNAGVFGGKPYRTHSDLVASSWASAIGAVRSCDVTQPASGNATKKIGSHFIVALPTAEVFRITIIRCSPLQYRATVQHKNTPHDLQATRSLRGGFSIRPSACDREGRSDAVNQGAEIATLRRRLRVKS